MTGEYSRSGTTLGPYQVGRLIGRGGMGEVYEAHDTVKGRDVALKLLPPHYVHNAEFRDRFEKESQTAARLSHPHIIPVHDFGEVDDLLFIDMRLVRGQDLRGALSSGPLPRERTINILQQVAAALDAAHRGGLLHRDVKPDNILLDEEDFAYLVDFGLAHGVGDARTTIAGVALGSLSYMAPERFNNQPTTSAADIYALTCVLFECLTGVPAFPGTTSHQLIDAQLNQPPPMTGAPVDAVLARGLSKVPSERYPTAKELVADAEAYLTGPGSHIVPVAPPAAPPPPPFSTPEGAALPHAPVAQHPPVQQAPAPHAPAHQTEHGLPAMSPPAANQQLLNQQPAHQQPMAQQAPRPPRPSQAPVYQLPPSQPYNPAAPPNPAQQMGWQPPPPEPRSSRWLVALAVVAVVAIIALIAVVATIVIASFTGDSDASPAAAIITTHTAVSEP